MASIRSTTPHPLHPSAATSRDAPNIHRFIIAHTSYNLPTHDSDPKPKPPVAALFPHPSPGGQRLIHIASPPDTHHFNFIIPRPPIPLFLELREAPPNLTPLYPTTLTCFPRPLLRSVTRLILDAPCPIPHSGDSEKLRSNFSLHARSDVYEEHSRPCVRHLSGSRY